MNYTQWSADGRPFRLARPVADLTAVLRRYGYTVGTIGNSAHLTARTPEDHTPYSATGWPRPSPYPWGHACDVMPPPAGKGLPSLAQLGAQIAADRQSNLPGISWLKYLNWTTSVGRCVHETWMPEHKVRGSHDTGHIHLSARTDHTRVASAYDPVARIRGHVAPLRPAVKPKPAVPAFGRVIRVTNPLMRGRDVAVWQRRMQALKYPIADDGVFGLQSQAALKRFQRSKKITADGVLGPVSWRLAWS